MKKHVLFVSYVFPPIGGAGVQRIIKFVKYLGDFDWKASVVTVSNPSVPLTDSSLLRDIPQFVDIYKTKTLEPSYNFKAGVTVKDADNKNTISFSSKLKSIIKNIARLVLLPDPQILWWPYTSIFLYKYLKSNKVDVIFASGPPFSNLVLAVFWGKFFKIPVVSDFRDEWTFSRNNWENLPKFKLIKWFDKQLEGYVVKNSTFVTVASPEYERTMRANYQIENCITITNGYDRDDFIPDGTIKVDLNKEKINIVYSGTVWGATSLKPFVKALENVLEAEPKLRDRVCFSIIGRVVPEEEYYFKSLQESGVVKMLGYINHDLLVKLIVAADILVLSLSKKEGSQKIIPGKIFEYMMCGAPVISIIPTGVCSEIVSKIDGFYISKPSDIDKIEDFIIQTIGNVQSGIVYKKNNVDEYSRKKLTGKLTIIFDDII